MLDTSIPIEYLAVALYLVFLHHHVLTLSIIGITAVNLSVTYQTNTFIIQHTTVRNL